jgi:hypothetical protein
MGKRTATATRRAMLMAVREAEEVEEKNKGDKSNVDGKEDGNI